MRRYRVLCRYFSSQKPQPKTDSVIDNMTLPRSKPRVDSIPRPTNFTKEMMTPVFIKNERRAFVDFCNWFLFHGGQFQWVFPARRKGKSGYLGRRGVFSTRKIPGGTPLIIVPASLSFGTKTLDREIRFAEEFRKHLPWGFRSPDEWNLNLDLKNKIKDFGLAPTDLNMLCKVLLFVLEKSSGDQSFWKSWIDLLPQSVPNFAAMTKEDRKNLEGTHAKHVVDNEFEKLVKVIEIIQLLSKYYPKLYPKDVYTPSQIAATWSVLISRSLMDETIPFVDFINYPDRPNAVPDLATKFRDAPDITILGELSAPDLTEMWDEMLEVVPDVALGGPNVELKTAIKPPTKDQPASAFMYIVSTREIAKHEEIFLKYGDFTNGELLSRYGFILPTSPSTFHLPIRINMPAVNYDKSGTIIERIRTIGDDPLTLKSWKPSLKHKGEVISLTETATKTKKIVESKNKITAEWDFEFPFEDKRLLLPHGFLPAMRCIYGPPKLYKTQKTGLTPLPETPKLLIATPNPTQLLTHGSSPSTNAITNAINTPKALTSTSPITYTEEDNLFEHAEVQWNVNFPYPIEDEREVHKMAIRFVEESLFRYPHTIREDDRLLGIKDEEEKKRKSKKKKR